MGNGVDVIGLRYGFAGRLNKEKATIARKIPSSISRETDRKRAENRLITFV
jgi:hypothetical protein